MKILAFEVETPAAQPEVMQSYLRLEAQKVWDLYKRGIISETYFRKEEHLAVFIIECQDLPEAWTHIRSLPLVEAGLIDFHLIPLIPYDGFARLFASQFEA